MKKYWYIWFGNFAFPFLALHTLIRIEKFPRLSQIKVYGNFFFLGIVVMGIPTLIVDALIRSAEGQFINIFPAVCFYITGIYATYSHARWREKYV